MDLTGHERARAIFSTAIELEPAARGEFLERACGDDPPLREEVEALIAEDAALDDAITLLVRRAAADLLEAEPAAAAPAAPPARLGPYPVLGVLGRGGMGVVYRAVDPRLGRPIAIKTLPSEFAHDPARRDGFEQEAKLLASINHPAIATIHSLEEEAGHYFLTMELVDGESLSARIESGRLPLTEALSVGRQIASALEAAHAAGIVHRDLKPLNVMMRPDGHLKVLDFGLAKLIGVPELEPWGEHFTGTPGYASPEQVRGWPVDHRSDIWAFSAILFECLTGKAAYPGSSPFEKASATLHSEPDWGLLPTTTPAQVMELLRRGLTRNASARLESMTVARRALEEAIATHALSTLRESRDADAGARRTDGDRLRAHNLPYLLSSFIGREPTIDHLAQLLEQNRLITLVGFGGVGKTRLALELAMTAVDRFPHGARWVDLSRITSGDQVRLAVAGSLGLTDGGRDSLRTITDALRERALLLLLDNCEHVLVEAAEVAQQILEACPQVRVLATSRERLAIHGEVAYPVPPLGLPDARPSLRDLEKTDASRLFLERARSARPDFRLTEANAPAVAQICRHLDGIPLAVELAAARVRSFTPEEIALRLDERLSLLTSASRTIPPKHQTLRATLDWSHKLLSAPEMLLFRRLAVFRGGWSLAAAEEVAPGNDIPSWEFLDLHARLVDKSLVELDTSSPQRARYRMLETVREYAAERLVEAGEEALAQLRHRGYFFSLAAAARPHLRGPAQRTWLDRLAADHDNLMSALARALGEEDPTSAVLATEALGAYWEARGHWSEGRVACRHVLELPRHRTGPGRYRVLAPAAALAYRLGDYSAAEAYAFEAVAASREHGDLRTLSSATNVLGLVAFVRGQHEQARSHYESVLANLRELKDRRATAALLANIANVDYVLGNYTAARARQQEALAIRRVIRDVRGTADSLQGLGHIASDLQELETAEPLYREALALSRQVGDERGAAGSLQGLGLIQLERGEHEAARATLEEVRAIREKLDDREGLAMALNNLALVACALGDFATARSHALKSLQMGQELQNRRGLTNSWRILAKASLGLGDTESAAVYGCNALEIVRETGNERNIAPVLSVLGRIAARKGDFPVCTRLLAAADARLKKPAAVEVTFPHRDALEAAHAALGEKAFQTEWAVGSGMSTEDAVALAFSVGGRGI